MKTRHPPFSLDYEIYILLLNLCTEAFVTTTLVKNNTKTPNKWSNIDKKFKYDSYGEQDLEAKILCRLTFWWWGWEPNKRTRYCVLRGIKCSPFFSYDSFLFLKEVEIGKCKQTDRRT